MTERMKAGFEKVHRYLFPAILLLYPLRHINWGLDLQDTGYSYANFQFMGMEHMDPMWLFSTYLANGAGALLMKLPFGNTLLGMNLYTALTVSLLALLGYWFCIKKAGMPAGPVFLGEILAVSLCWCPTAVLYNYLTYIFFLGGCICLYLGLRDDCNKLLVIAGVFLGANIFVRFSNLAEAGLILAVWAYGVICRRKFSKVAAQTGWCMLGYFGTAGVILCCLGLVYGVDTYVEGVLRLFSMTENATDYTPMAMVTKMLTWYLNMVYWVLRIGVFVVAGLVVCSVLPGRWVKVKQAVSVLFMSGAIVWLYVRGFCNFQFQAYDSMLLPGVLFLMIAIGMGMIVILLPAFKREDKLLSGMVILIILLTPLGSNNGLYPSLNNLFVAGPYVFYMVWRLAKSPAVLWPKEEKRKWLELRTFPVKTAALMLCGMILVQSLGFGAGFVFVEAHGATGVDTKVENNKVLRGISMSGERARWMSQISAYVAENELEGREVILYGGIPSLAFYLNMPPAFNSWSDLLSYSLTTMEKDMEELRAQIGAGCRLPVVILEKQYEQYRERAKEEPKVALIVSFMDEFDYQLTFSNEKFLVLEGNEDERGEKTVH